MIEIRCNFSEISGQEGMRRVTAGCQHLRYAVRVVGTRWYRGRCSQGQEVVHEGCEREVCVWGVGRRAHYVTLASFRRVRHRTRNWLRNRRPRKGSGATNQEAEKRRAADVVRAQGGDHRRPPRGGGSSAPYGRRHRTGHRPTDRPTDRPTNRCVEELLMTIQDGSMPCQRA